MGKVLVHGYDRPIVREKLAAAGSAILEGMLLQKASGANTWEEHGTAQGVAEPIFALEGKDNIDHETTAYAVGALVPAIVRPPMVNAWLKDGEVVVEGDALVSAGDGTLQKFVAGDEALLIKHAVVVGFADEAKSPSGANVRIKVRVA